MLDVGGDPSAQFAVSQRFYEGTITPQDYAEAAAWIKKAAEQGHEKGKRGYVVALEHVAIDDVSDPNTVYINLDDLKNLDVMLRNAGLGGVEGWGDLSTFRTHLSGQ